MKNYNFLSARILLLLASSILLTGCDKYAKPTRSFEIASKGLHAAEISPDGAFVIAGSIYHGGSLWRIEDFERLFNWNHKNGEFTTIVAADFAEQGKWALTADVHTLVLWDLNTGQAPRYWIAPGEILDVELSPSGNHALLGLSDHTAVIFDIQRGGVKRTFHHENRVRSVDFSGDGRYAISGSEDRTAIVWDVLSGEKLYTFRHQEEVQLVKLSFDGNLALTASKYDKAMLWDARTGQPVAEIPLGAQHLKRGVRFTAAEFSRDNQLLVTGRPDQIVTLWDISTMNQIKQWELPKRDAWKPTSAAVIALSFQHNRETIAAVASNGFVHLLNTNE